MEATASKFETCEMLGMFLASTPLLSQSWTTCSLLANTTSNFVIDTVGGVGYLAFSWASTLNLELIMNNNESNKLVPIDHNGIFSTSLHGYDRGDEEGEAPMVHAGFLNLFLSLYNTPDFQKQMLALMEQTKAIVITGHSIGGTTASLATLWLLSYLHSLSSHLPVLCITFGSPLLGNESLSQAILRERWGGKFCHLVSKQDYMLAHFVLTSTTRRENSLVPFGSYLFCSKEGAICIDNAIAVVKLLHLICNDASVNFSYINNHLGYGEVVMRVSQQFLENRCFTQGVLSESSHEAGISLALEAPGFATQECRAILMEARQMGCAPNINSANLAIRLSKITPYRAEIEWYKSRCDDCDHQMGYYDSFKHRGARRDLKVNMNRIKLAHFWDGVLKMVESSELPHDFHRRAKWVNASQFYKLLVEPLDIAHYYQSGSHITKGHYLTHGRERRYKIFDKWWKDRKLVEKENYKRNNYAGLTQDSCFWAKVEEANEWVKNARTEISPQILAQLLQKIEKFEFYAKRLVENKEVSKDVVAQNSSYSTWLREWKELKPQSLQTLEGFHQH